MSKFTIGCLMPVSGIIQSMAKDFVKGLELGFNNNVEVDCQLEIIPEIIGPGNILTVNEVISKMLNFHEVDMITGILNSIVAKECIERINTSRIPFVLNNLGEFTPLKELQSDFLIYNGMHLWQSQWMLGYMMQKEHGGIPTIGFTNYDGGYQLVDSFRLGAIAAGAEDVKLNIFRLEENIIDTTELLSMFENVEPGHLHFVLCGVDGQDFIKKFAESDLADKFPISASPFLVGDGMLREAQEHVVGWKNVNSWSEKLELAENRTFCDEYSKAHDKAANVFALMGYETGLGLATIFNQHGVVQNETLAKAFAELEFDGPRGKTTYSLDSWQKVSEHWLCEPQSLDGKVSNQVSKALKLSDFPKEALQLNMNQISAGWQNIYLCI